MNYLILASAIVLVYLGLRFTLFKNSQKLRTVQRATLGIVIALTGFVLFQGSFFYAERGYVYHVRTITGHEDVVVDVGYNPYFFGKYNVWKEAVTVQALSGTGAIDQLDAENMSSRQASAVVRPQNIVFLDQVDANVEASVRFKIPTDRDTFLSLVKEYRTPDNLLRTSLIPAFRETLQATSSLMTAEEYYSGGRTEFNIEFDRQMRDGIYIVKRIERVQKSLISQTASANASKGTEQDTYGDNDKVVYVVEKQYDSNGDLIRKKQNYLNYGVTVVDPRIMGMSPNQKFKVRMEQKQDASAERAVAREQRIQEEEQEQLVVARGKREIAERQAQAKVEQIERTTKAETEKQLALTKALKVKEQAEIEKEAAAIQLDRDKLIAQSQKVLADAEAYKRTAIIESDNALQQKLDAEIAIQKHWADAFAKRKVPSTMFVTGSDSGSGQVGSNTELQNMMQMMTMQMAKTLNNDRTVESDK